MESLYHYCTPDTFSKIVETGSIRLSSLRQSSDRLEGRLTSFAARRYCSKHDVHGAAERLMTGLLAAVEESFVGLGFCVSEAPDLLSQWRGYAADGAGFSIGFAYEEFERLAYPEDQTELPEAQLVKIAYAEAEHDERLASLLTAMRVRIENAPPIVKRQAEVATQETLHEVVTMLLRTPFVSGGAFSLMDTLGISAIAAAADLYALKPSAFAEEQEWRLVTEVPVDQLERHQFALRSSAIVPFQTIELSRFSAHAIRHVIMGPKCRTPKVVVEQFLKRHGVRAPVALSSASYC